VTCGVDASEKGRSQRSVQQQSVCHHVRGNCVEVVLQLEARLAIDCVGVIDEPAERGKAGRPWRLHRDGEREPAVCGFRKRSCSLPCAVTGSTGRDERQDVPPEIGDTESPNGEFVDRKISFLSSGHDPRARGPRDPLISHRVGPSDCRWPLVVHDLNLVPVNGFSAAFEVGGRSEKPLRHDLL
jgi:hypothetical protein